jgi:hypothetical protein
MERPAARVTELLAASFFLRPDARGKVRPKAAAEAPRVRPD